MQSVECKLSDHRIGNNQMETIECWKLIASSNSIPFDPCAHSDNFNKIFDFSDDLTRTSFPWRRSKGLLWIFSSWSKRMRPADDSNHRNRSIKPEKRPYGMPFFWMLSPISEKAWKSEWKLKLFFEFVFPYWMDPIQSMLFERFR